MTKHVLKILPLGGLGEIGMNCLVLEWENELVLVDCGIQFPDSSYPGVDLLTPDLQYVFDRVKQIRGVVVTHGHDDHIGAIPYLLRETPLTVYATPFPQGLIRQRLEEHTDLKEIEFVEIKPKKAFEVGPFKFHPIRVQHSIIESLGFAIETPVGTLIHSGDFKHDPNELRPGEKIGFEEFAHWGKKGVQLLLSDSTNAEQTGHTLSEKDISKSFETFFKEQTGRIFIALFASNIRRIENFLKLAKKRGKRVVLAGRSMHSYTRLAHELSALNIPEETLILAEHAKDYPDDEIIILITGSQAEPQSALVRISQGIHRELEIKPTDKIILSSRFIPGNERAITRMIDQLYRMGAEVIYESIHQIHVSGHGFQEELEMMLKAAKPNFFVPIHGEYRHLAKHVRIAQETGVKPKHTRIIENGQMLLLGKHSLELGENYGFKKGVVVDGQLIEASVDQFQDRQKLSKAGVAFVVINTDRGKRRLLRKPRVATVGVLLRRGYDPKEVLEDVEDHLEEIFYEAGHHDVLEDLIRLETRRFFKKCAAHKPVVMVIIIED